MYKPFVCASKYSGGVSRSDAPIVIGRASNLLYF